jgi:hypothetical protein
MDPADNKETADPHCQQAVNGSLNLSTLSDGRNPAISKTSLSKVAGSVWRNDLSQASRATV